MDSDSADDSDSGHSHFSANGAVEEVGYKLPPGLKEPATPSYSTKGLYELWKDNYIILDPTYQRDIVWPRDKQIALIDSLMRGYPILPVLFAIRINDDGGEEKVCIDGKQRLTSIFRFLSGEIPYKDPVTKKALYFRPPQTKRNNIKLLPKAMRVRFQNKTLLCYQYTDVSEEIEKDIFRRVQLGVPLKPSEKWQAISSPRADFARELVRVYLKDTDPLICHLGWSTARSNGFKTVIQSLVAISTLRDGIDVTESRFFSRLDNSVVIEKWLSCQDPIDSKLQKRVTSVYEKLVALVKSQIFNPILINVDGDVKKWTAIEFCIAITLVETWMDTLSSIDIAKEIASLRIGTRTRFPDLRSHGKIIERMIQFVVSLDWDEVDSNIAHESKKSSKSKAKIGKPKKRPSLDDHGASTSTSGQASKKLRVK